MRTSARSVALLPGERSEFEDDRRSDAAVAAPVPPGGPFMTAGPVDLDAGLRRFGFDRFRPGQRHAIETLLEQRRALLVAPTGGGKSLTYQLPAALLPGTTIVVSPLIALMHDQVAALRARGVRAAYLASTLPAEELRRHTEDLASGSLDLLYVAPERLGHPRLWSLLDQINCPLIAIDEAHCISEWGHDFRPDYLQIGTLLTRLPDARVLACTATATPIVRDEILARLGLPADTAQLIHGFARPNLAFRVEEVASKRHRTGQVDAVLAETIGAPSAGNGTAIVYAPTRRETESEATRLTGQGWRAAGYHAGLAGAVRDRVQRSFMSDELDIVVATNSFGMGIDRSDVRCVVHLAPPGSIESYYQEAGRAGRDGRDAVCLLLTSPGDLGLRRRLIDRDANPTMDEDEHARHKWQMFLELMRWSESGSCRHDGLLRYFGDLDELLAGCGRCDVCQAIERGTAEADELDTQLVVRKALSGVARVHGRFGQQAAVALLHGDDDDRLSRARLDQTPTHGVLGDYPTEWLGRLLRRCVSAGWVDFSGGDRPVLLLTAAGRAVMQAQRPARLLLPPRGRRKRNAGPVGPSGSGESSAAGMTDAESLEGDDLRLFEALRAFRIAVARREQVPPYVVASDRTLREIAVTRPVDRGALLHIHGIGPAKAEKYGDDLIGVVVDDGNQDREAPTNP